MSGVTKSKRIGWARHVARTREKIHTEFWWGKLKERDDYQHLGVGGRILLKRIITKYAKRMWSGIMWLTTGTNEGLL
jgi:hypothetical protein